MQTRSDFFFLICVFLVKIARKLESSRKALLAIMLLFSLPLFLLAYKQSVSFHFIDEYNNFMAGYFLLKGKTLYSQIFFQHQPLMAYISYVLQKLLHPNDLYKLVIYHRFTVFCFALLFDFLLVFRLRLAGFVFVCIFELTKYFLFGTTFLAESFVVYPIVYILGVVWDVLQKRNIKNIDFWLATIGTWFVLWMREPYIPITLFLYLILLLSKRSLRTKIGAIVLITSLSSLTIMSLPLHDYLFELITVNQTAVIAPEFQSNHIAGFGAIALFLYPLLIFFQGIVTYFRGVLILVDLLFLFTFFQYFIHSKQWKNGLCLIFILGISNIRMIPPGTVYFGAYHMLVWYGLFVMMTLLLVSHLYRTEQHTPFRLFTSLFLFVLGLYIVSPINAFIWTKFDKQSIFNTNYGQYYVNGEVVRQLADSRTTFFVDGWDSLVYWQANQPVSYPFLFFYPPMQYFKLYTNARANMFQTNSPEFVYTGCTIKNGNILGSPFPENTNGEYTVFYSGANPTCLYMKTASIKQVPKNQWKNIKPFGYYLK
ncbi:MAG TPA: hypothetical protein VGT05_05230 [Patescibacteria group bacterium]|nr:hypothetical protein [Patescibacteria group bacterium]